MPLVVQFDRNEDCSCVYYCRRMHYHLSVDNQVEVSEYISSCGIQQDRKGAFFICLATTECYLLIFVICLRVFIYCVTTFSTVTVRYH